MTERQRAYHIERRIDLLAEAMDLESYELPIVYDELRVAAEEAMAAEEQGAMMAYDMVVLVEPRDVFPIDTGRWRYRAVLAKNVPEGEGCREHRGINACSLKWAAVEAVAVHQRQCIGQ